mgnify:CR=1 FL=1|tara:strand:+ start:85 stop:729 length:645 start_codon:yes stop_codon:yes gene_type:complete
MRIQKLLATGLFIIMSLGVFAQGFEGSIYFTKSNMVDVTQYVYHVKDDMVRIDEMVEGSDNLVATLLVNLESGDMIALSHERNLYMKRPHKDGESGSIAGAVVVNGQLKRSIHGANCSQIRVKNKAADREVMYWVSDDADYDFFPKLLSILKRKDNFSTYYMSIPEVGNKLPLLAQENTLLREKKGFLQVDKLEKKTLDDSLFKIPAGFEKVER